jgi:arginyl-tRNA synthetase
MAQKWTKLLQGNYPQATFMWEKIKQISLKSVREDLDKLGVKFDLWLGESNASGYLTAVGPYLPNVRESEGALLAGNYDPPLMLKNSAGVWLYAATDLATILMREEQGADEIIYVVDERQALHFKQVFDVGQHITDAKLTHVGFGTVNGPDGKPFKTREGDTPSLKGLLNEAEQKALARTSHPESAHRIALAALKFNDLKNKRTTNYTFDLEAALSHEGHTGVYLLYTVTRINSIESKALAAGVKPTEMLLDTPAKRQLGLTMANFNQVVSNAWENKMPHFICEHLLSLASQFNVFYAHENIGNSPENLALALEVQNQLTLGLILLGIGTVQKM